jgi:HEPN domain-containing protein
MTADDPAAEVRRWLRYAGEDLEAARALLHHLGAAPREACYLAQQAAEKALKAALIFQSVEFPLTHDLDRLQTLFPAGWRVVSEHPDLSRLSGWVIEARYPGDWPDATDADAQQAVAQAEAVLASVQRDLQVRGWTG